MKFRKKPVVIEAVQFKGDFSEVLLNLGLLHPSLEQMQFPFKHDGAGKNLFINTSKGVKRAELGDWIVKDEGGEFYAYHPAIFDAIYEAVK